MHEPNPPSRSKHEHTMDSPERPSGLFYELTAFQRDILTILAGHDAPAGVDIHAELTAYYGTSVEHSRVYQALTKLADKHLVGMTKQDGRKNAYHLTTLGKRVLVDGNEFKAMVGGEMDD